MYYNYLLVLSLNFILLNTAYAQHTISGQIKEINSEEILPGATVYIVDLKKSAVTDFDGNYEFKNIKKGNHLLEVSYPGYTTINQRIHIESDTHMDFYLETAVTELGDIVVTGVSRSTERKRSPVVIKALESNSLNRKSATNLIDGLKSTPGVSQITTGASVSKPVIRGLGFNRILTLNNGIRQEGQQWGDEHGIEIDEYAVDRIEIIKGPGSLIYGSDAIGGVLNFLPPKFLSQQEVKTQFISNYQSNNQLLGHSISNQGTHKDFQWLARISHKTAGNYKNKFDGKVLNSGFKELNGNFTVGLNRKWGHSYLSLNSFNTDLGIVEGERDDQGRFTFENEEGETVTADRKQLSHYKIGFPYQKINHLSLASNTYFILPKGELKADLGFQVNKRKEYEDPVDPDEIEMYLKLNTFTYNFRYDFEERRNWSTTVGIGGMQQNNKNGAEEYLIPDYDLWDIGGFIYTQKRYDRLTISGGLRMDFRFLNTKSLYLDDDDEPVAPTDPNAEVKFEEINTTFNGISGSIGLAYQINKSSTFKFNISRGYRAPNIAELASNGKHEGTFRYEVGNADLKTESSNQIDLGYYLDSKHLTFEFTPFINYIENYIYIQKMEAQEEQERFPDLEDAVSAYEFLGGNATLYGGEIYVDIHPHPLDWIHFENTFSYVRGIRNKKSDESRNLPSIPAPKYVSELKFDLPNIGEHISKLYTQIGVEHNFNQNKYLKTYDTETYTKGYTLLSLGIGARLKVKEKADALQLFIHADNLTNVAFQDHLSRLKYAPINNATGRTGVFNKGRNISFKLLVNL